MSFQIILVVLLWVYYLVGTVVVHFIIMFLNLFLTSPSQLMIWISVQWPLFELVLFYLLRS